MVYSASEYLFIHAFGCTTIVLLDVNKGGFRGGAPALATPKFFQMRFF